MKNFSKYLAYRLKESSVYFLVITVILSIMAMSADVYIYEYDGLLIGINIAADGLWCLFAIFAFKLYLFIIF